MEAYDPLEKYRRPGEKPAALPEADEPPPSAQRGYRAFAVSTGATKPVRLELRPKTGLAVARSYTSITEIAYDRGSYEGILLSFPLKLVSIQGKNLLPVVEALLLGTAEFLAELGDGEHAERGAPVITKIALAGPPAAPQKPAAKAEG